MKLFKTIIFVLGISCAFPASSNAQSNSQKPVCVSIDESLVDSFFPSEEKLRRLSPVCSFEFDPKNGYTNKSEVSVSMSYQKTEYRPRIYEWNEMGKKWTPLKTLMNRTTLKVSADIKNTSAILAVFADETDVYEGLASWYRHKRYPAGSATNVFPIGTKLRVTNTKNGKSTLVTVTSTWTQTDPRRALDLVSTAFQKIGNLRAGLIAVRVEKIQ